jgi:hypothetical protein
MFFGDPFVGHGLICIAFTVCDTDLSFNNRYGLFYE